MNSNHSSVTWLTLASLLNANVAAKAISGLAMLAKSNNWIYPNSYADNHHPQAQSAVNLSGYMII